MIKKKCYRFAGLEILVTAEEDLLYQKEYRLEAFSVDGSGENAISFHYEVVDSLPSPAGSCIAVQPNMRVYRTEDAHWRYVGASAESTAAAYMAAEYRGRDNRVYLRRDKFPGRMGTKTVLETMAAEHLIARNNGFIFHCSYIDCGGKAILFTAPSETGKSTQAELWRRHRNAEIINGDRAAVRLVDGVLMAEGIPFAGSSQYCKKRSLPIEAIVYLAQAPETSIRQLRGREAFFKIWEGVSVNTWDKRDLELVSGVVQQAAMQVPVFYLPCTPDESAVIALEQALRKNG